MCHQVCTPCHLARSPGCPRQPATNSLLRSASLQLWHISCTSCRPREPPEWLSIFRTPQPDASISDSYPYCREPSDPLWPWYRPKVSLPIAQSNFSWWASPIKCKKRTGPSRYLCSRSPPKITKWEVAAIRDLQSKGRKTISMTFTGCYWC